MTTVVAAHAVGDMKTWLEGGDERAALFKAKGEVRGATWKRMHP